MADPIMPNGIRVQSVLQGITGLPTDRFVNTWAFRTPGPPSDADLDEAMDAVAAFFNTLASGASHVISFYLPAGQIDNAACELRAYRLGDTPPREPRIQPLPLPGMSSNTGLPSEVACCSSFYATRSLPNTRGRVFIGPLITSVVELGGDGCVRPLPAFMLDLTLAMKALAGRSSTVTFCVLGRPAGVATLQTVTGGWVDNAFDTQRRRGPDQSARIPWALP